MSIRTVFFGTSSFAVPSLQALLQDSRFIVTRVVTQPDRPIGRHAKAEPSPIKSMALKNELPLSQFESLKSKDVEQALREENADLFIVASYGQIIPKGILEIPKYGCINVHGSLLPNYRGASPIYAAIKNGDEKTGVTIMLMDELLDHGPILYEQEEPILASDTTAELHGRLAQIGAKILPDTIVKYIKHDLIPQIQDESKATKTKILTREDGLIDWSKSSTDVERLIRASNPWPGTYTQTDRGRLKIIKASLGTPSNKQFTMMCSDGRPLILDEVQPEGKKPMSGEDYLRGLPKAQ